MKHDEDDLENMLNDVPFDDSIDPVHKAKLKNAVMHAYMTGGAHTYKPWRNVAAIIFAIALGLVIGTQIWREMKTRNLPVQKPGTIASVQPAPQPQTKQDENSSIWVKESWRTRLSKLQAAQRSQKNIWGDSAQKPTATAEIQTAMQLQMTQQDNLPVWAQESLRRRLATAQISQYTQKRTIWISSTQKTTQGEEQ